MEWWNFNFFKKSIDGSYDDVEHLKWKLKMSLFINHSAPNASGTFPFVKMDFFNFWSKSVHLRSKWLVFERFWAIFEQKYEISRNHKNRLKSPILTLRCLKWAQMSEDWFIIPAQPALAPAATAWKQLSTQNFTIRSHPIPEIVPPHT